MIVYQRAFCSTCNRYCVYENGKCIHAKKGDGHERD